jgi:arylsulfatase A-like enzyme
MLALAWEGDMRVRQFLGLLVALVAVTPAPAGAPARRPNVIVLITDDQGYGDLSCHGNPVLKTPHLDELHKTSVRLTDFHVAPMCTPTRSQLLTGIACLRNGAMNVSSGRTLLRRGIPTLADHLAALGYRTGMFGKWHLGDNYPYRPQDRGFHKALFFPSSHIGSAPDFFSNCYYDDTYQHDGRRERFEGYCTDVFFDQALRWMKSCVAERRPFFTYLATNTPHGPLFVPQRYRDLYKQQPPNLARFFGMIANIDDNVGKLESFLREAGVRDDTLLVFLTDNGGTAGVQVYNAGMRGRKIELFDGGHRVPCFVRWPAGKLRPPGDVGALTQVQDLVPTLVNLCGGDVKSRVTLDGISLAPLLRGDVGALPERTLVVQFSRMNAPRPEKGDACVLRQRWRLVQDKELYDLAADPAQKVNVIDKHPHVAQRLREDYERWWWALAARVNDHEAIVVGDDAENPLQLSPADWEDVFLDQGRQVREGLRRNGPWNIEVAHAGRYQIALRRWPAEADVAIRAGLPAVKHADGVFSAGVALPVASARLRVADFDARQEVTADLKSVQFEMTLAAGRTRLQSWFLDDAGQEIAGAYYVIVRRVGPTR